MNLLKKTFALIRHLPKLYSIGGVVVIAVVVVVGVNHFNKTAPGAQVAISNLSHVQVATVSDLSSQAGPLSIIGKVTSLSQATILAQTSGEITVLSHSIGDHVDAGDIIAEFENSSQRAAVLQAQGAYDAAQAALAKASGTTAQNSNVTSAQAVQGVANARTSALAALQSVYAALDDAIHTRADLLFLNPRTSSPQITLTVPDSQLVATLQSERVALEATLTQAQTVANDGTAADIDTNSSLMAVGAQSVVVFLDNLIRAVNETPPSQSASAATLAADQTSLAAARTEAVAAITSVTSAKSAYDTAIAGAATASNSAQSGTTNDVAIAEANAKQALGALDAAKANEEKTIIRSPISGTIVSLPITQGGYVPSFAQVAIISNPGALYVDSQVTSSDAKTIAVGNTAVVAGTEQGTITFIAPALDPMTGNIEVKIGLKGNQHALTDGEVVAVSLDRTQSKDSSTAGSVPAQITIPIIATKILPSGPIVFTVSTTSALVAHPVVLGSILGDRVVVISGVTPDMSIVTDARGLADGQTVIVDPN